MRNWWNGLGIGSKIFLGILGFLIVVGVVSPKKSPKPGEPAAAEAESKAEAPKGKYDDMGKHAAWNASGREAIQSKLKDPDSADFRNVAFHSGGGVPVTCGEVNAKNGFGGFSGFERFVAAGSSLQVLESEMGAGEMDKLWDKICVG